MRTLSSVVLICLAATLIAGCASSGKRDEPSFHAGDENPPDFLTGPVSAILTNLDGFSAHVVITTTSMNGVARVKSGDLLGRDGRLIFQRAMTKGKRARAAGGLFFIWDTTKGSGYVMSEGLQGYAPIKSDTGACSLLSVTKEEIKEQVDDHPCQRCRAVVQSPDGKKSSFTLWQAEDAGHFPVRIEGVDGPDKTTFDFSAMRMEYPSEQLFTPPEGFTSYPSSVAMMNELLTRESSLSKKTAQGEFDEPTDVHSSNWHGQ